MAKIKINMLSTADKIDGQGVGSAYLEQVALLKEGASDIFDISVNAHVDADIQHIHTVDPTNYMKMKKTKGVNVCYVHFLPDTLDGSIKLPRVLFRFFKAYVVRVYKRADYLIVVNPIFINKLVEHGMKRERIVYIPNYVSKADFYRKSDLEIENMKQAYGVDPNAFVVLGVGQVQTRKGVLDFIEVAKQLPDITFVWCGGFSFGRITDGYAELKKVVSNPPENVKFLGIIPREHMNDMYNIANILFMPSYNELFPMAILEAVNLHKPLLLRDLKLYEDILFHKYDAGSDNEEFVEKIKVLRRDSQTYQTAQLNAKEISDYYAKENVLELWKSFYIKVYEEHQKKHAS